MKVKHRKPRPPPPSEDDWIDPFQEQLQLEETGDPLADIYGEAPTEPIAFSRPRQTRPHHWQTWIKTTPMPVVFAPLAQLQTFGQAGSLVTGQMPMAAVLRHALTVTGPADVTLSTWTLNEDNVEHLAAMREAGSLRRLTLLLDPTMPRQEQQGNAFLNLVALSGRENLRLAHNHAKFALVDGERSSLQIFTSANWNSNPRNEWSIATADPQLRAWIEAAFVAPIFQEAQTAEEDFETPDLDLAELSDFDVDPFDTRPRHVVRKADPSAYLEQGRPTADATLPRNLPGLEYVAAFTTNRMHAIHVLDWLIRDLGGRARLALSSWRMNRSNMEALNHLKRSGLISDIRLILDPSMRTREPEAWPTIFHSTGPENIRIQHNHAKFAILEAGDRRIALLSSANWNDNPRPEFIWIREDPEMHAWIQGYVDHVFSNGRKPTS